MKIQNLHAGPLIKVRRNVDDAEVDVFAEYRINNGTQHIAQWVSDPPFVSKWYNQVDHASSLGSIGQKVWFTTSPRQDSTAVDQPVMGHKGVVFMDTKSRRGLLFVKNVPAFEFPGPFTIALGVWANSLADFQSFLGLGHHRTGILLRTDCMFVLGQNIENAVLKNHMTTKKWTSVVITRNEANLVTLWVDGMSKASRFVSGTVNPSNTTLDATTNSGLFLGCNGHTSEEGLDGEISECVISKAYMNPWQS